MDALTICYGFLVMAGIVAVFMILNIAIQKAAARRPGGEYRPLYWQACERSQAELLARVPSNIRGRGLNRNIYHPDFSGQRQFSHLELFPGELYEYVQRWDNGRLTDEYITQNGYSLAKGGDYV